jgi:hypothetical protein
MAKQQKLWRLGMTEMVSPSPEEPQRADYNSARWSARWLFLLAIQKYAPAVLSDLRRRADESGAVHAWAQRWRLPLWVQPYAVETRRLWSENPDLPNGWIESGDAFADGKGELVTELSPHPPPEYDPRYETSAGYMARVRGYIKGREDAAQKRGYIRRQRQDPRAFRSLVQRVVLDVPYAEI